MVSLRTVYAVRPPGQPSASSGFIETSPHFQLHQQRFSNVCIVLSYKVRVPRLSLELETQGQGQPRAIWECLALAQLPGAAFPWQMLASPISRRFSSQPPPPPLGVGVRGGRTQPPLPNRSLGIGVKTTRPESEVLGQARVLIPQVTGAQMALWKPVTLPSTS